uniref:Uncharacterized protein n=1 Tax=Anguilla anguilla TaxID=7936 RepID=A0A0E9UJF4_ANGAN
MFENRVLRNTGDFFYGRGRYIFTDSEISISDSIGPSFIQKMYEDVKATDYFEEQNKYSSVMHQIFRAYIHILSLSRFRVGGTGIEHNLFS